ncbi:MAG: hypothetical protein ACE5D0_03205 [Fidelibacterota bacterium]
MITKTNSQSYLTAQNEPLDIFFIRLTLFLSGFCGIAYEVLYNRLLGNMIGDHFAVNASILVTFLLGIGLGTKFAHRFKGFLWAVEGGIGLYAIGFTLSAPLIDKLLFQVLPFQNLSVNVLFSCLLLIFPAFLVGVSLPLFSAYLQQLVPGRAFSRSYMIYNFGAALTALFIEFYLIRHFGLTIGMVSIAVLNLFIGTVLFLRRDRLNIRLKPQKVIHYPYKVIIPLIIVSLASAIFQLTMLKFAEFIYGPYHETFAMVLGIVLLGIALGTMLNHYYKVQFKAFIIINIVYLTLVIFLFPNILLMFSTLWRHLSPLGLIGWKLFILFLIMGPGAISFGAAIPALMKQESDIAKESGHLLFISSMANTVGYLFMVFIIHPKLEYGQILNLIIFLLVLALLVRLWPQLKLVGLAVLVALGSLLLVHEKWSENLLYMDYFTFTSPRKIQEELLSFRSSERYRKYDETFSINNVGPVKFFFINGYKSVPLNSMAEYLVGFISSLISPRLDQGLVLGLGSGATAGTVAEVFNHVDAVEISPTIIEKQPLMKEYSFDIMSKTNVNVVWDDGIRFMKTTTRKYDLILNTVTSPLYFSSSKLYTQEFYQQVKTRLQPDGIYTTWLDSRVGEHGLRIILKTLQSEFKYCWVTRMKSHYFLLVASNEKLQIRNEDTLHDNQKLTDYFASRYIRDIRNLRYSIINTQPYEYLNDDEKIPLNTIDLPALEFEIAHLNNPTIDSFIAFLRDNYDFSEMGEQVFSHRPIDLLELVSYYLKVDHQSTITQFFLDFAQERYPEFQRDLENYLLSFSYDVVNQYYTSESLDRLIFWQLYFKHIDHAEQTARMLFALEPDYYNTRYNIGLANEVLGNYELAAEMFLEEISRDENHCDAWYRLGRTRLKQNNLQAARASLLECLVRKPWYDDANYYVAKTYFMEGKYDSSQFFVQAELTLDPEDSKAQELLNKLKTVQSY